MSTSDQHESLDTVISETEPVGLTPRQARRIRVGLGVALLAVMGVLLVVRLGQSTSVLVVGVYGLAMTLCGVAIQLSRNGRTRLASWLMPAILLAALGADRLLP